MSEKVYFFSSCLVEHFFPQVGLDSVALLEHCGCRVIVPEFQSCCGQPAYNSGAPADAKLVAQKTIFTLSQYDIPVIVPSASCADMIRHHYPRMFKDEPSAYQSALDLAKRCFELLDFVADKLPSLPDAEKQIPKSLHISCSARRGLGCADSWRRAIQKAGFNPVEPEYAQECCGFGGTFSIKAPEISSAMAEDKCRFLAAQSEEFVSGDCGCLMHLNGYANKSGLALQGTHAASLLAKAYGLTGG